MDEKLRAVADQVPEKPPRSKLEPYTDLIRELRAKRANYEEIARFFAEHVHHTVTPSTIHAFVKVGARRAQRVQIELPAESSAQPRVIKDEARFVSPSTEDVRNRITALRQRATNTSIEERPFEYNEDEQLRFEPKVAKRKRD